MDIYCRKCGEPWERYHLEHDMTWFEPADNGAVPPEVISLGEHGWYRFVLAGKGCPSCYGHTGTAQTCPECTTIRTKIAANPAEQSWRLNDGSTCPVQAAGVSLTLAQLDEMDAASEGELSDYL